MQQEPALWRALTVATLAHKYERRKVVDTPYLIHPLRVASILAAYGMPEDPFGIAALLHDTAEHGKLDLLEIRRDFGPEVARLIGGVTLPSHTGPWRARKMATLESLRAADTSVLILACADKLDNLISIREDLGRLGECIWERLGRSPQSQAWYYESLAEVFAERLHTGQAAALTEEFCAEVRRVFARAN